MRIGNEGLVYATRSRSAMFVRKGVGRGDGLDIAESGLRQCFGRETERQQKALKGATALAR